MGELKRGEFYPIYFFDENEKTFGVGSTINEHDDVDDRTWALQCQGRRVRICVGGLSCDRKGFHPENFILSAPEGYRFDPYLKW